MILSGTVVPGEKAGRTIGFPTANLKLKRELKIKPGVYAAVCTLGKTNHLGLAYWGKRYIFGDKVNSFEVYLLNFKGNIYGKKLTVKLLDFIRGPKRLKSLAAVKKTLTHDLKTMTEKKVILVNRKDEILGIADLALAHQNPPKLHRAVSVLLKNKKGELLLQQRSKFKSLWPLYWSNTSCTNVRPGETTLAAAQRSLWRELKLKAKLKYQKKFIYRAKYDRRHSEYEVDYVFTGVVAGKPRANKKEVADWRFIGPGEVKKLLRVRLEQFTPWFKLGIIKP